MGVTGEKFGSQILHGKRGIFSGNFEPLVLRALKIIPREES